MDGRQVPGFELLLFTRDVDLAARAVAAGVDGIVIDWERAGKRARQLAADTEINLDTVDDLRRMRMRRGAADRLPDQPARRSNAP